MPAWRRLDLTAAEPFGGFDGPTYEPLQRAQSQTEMSRSRFMTGLPHSADRRSPFFGAGGGASLGSLKTATQLSVVVPCYNETGNLQELVRRLADACARCVGQDYELILVNDCSSDDTWPGILAAVGSEAASHRCGPRPQPWTSTGGDRRPVRCDR